MCYADAAMLSTATEERLQILEGTAGFPNIQLAEIVRALVWQYMREAGNGFDQAQQDVAVVRAFRAICEALTNQAGPLGAVHVQGLVQDKDSAKSPSAPSPRRCSSPICRATRAPRPRPTAAARWAS